MIRIEWEKESDILGAVEAAQALGYSRQYVTQLCREQKLESEKIGKTWVIRRAAIKTYEQPARGRPLSTDTRRRMGFI